MEEKLLKLLQKNKIGEAKSLLLEQNITTLSRFVQCTPADILNNFQKFSNKILYCYQKLEEYYSPREISNFLLQLINPPLAEKFIKKFEDSIQNLFSEYNCWDELFQFIEDIPTSHEDSNVKSSILLFSYIIRPIVELQGMKAKQKLNNKEFLKILIFQKYSQDYRILIPKMNLQILSEEIAKAKENSRIRSQVLEYFKRNKRTNIIEPEPIIKFQIPPKRSYSGVCNF